jgi:prepilin-type N-terminal cleavage/methylation domain-containing protein
MNKKYEGGFTLIEVIVAIAVVAILAGTITPSVIKHLNDSKRSRALNDCMVIGSTIANFYKDTGRAPNMTNTGATGGATMVLVSTGNTPTGPGQWIAAVGTGANATDLLSNHLSANTPQGQTASIYPSSATAPGAELQWRGSYQDSFPPDPWGNRYAVNIGNWVNTTATTSNAVWALSAGPDGIIQTAFNPNLPATGQTLTTAGDDIAYRIR